MASVRSSSPGDAAGAVAAAPKAPSSSPHCQRGIIPSSSPPPSPSAPLSTVMEIEKNSPDEEYISFSANENISVRTKNNTCFFTPVAAGGADSDGGKCNAANIKEKETKSTVVSVVTEPGVFLRRNEDVDVEAGSDVHWICQGTDGIESSPGGKALEIVGNEATGGAGSQQNKDSQSQPATSFCGRALFLTIMPEGVDTPPITRKIPCGGGCFQNLFDRPGRYTYYVCSSSVVTGCIVANAKTTEVKREQKSEAGNSPGCGHERDEPLQTFLAPPSALVESKTESLPLLDGGDTYQQISIVSEGLVIGQSLGGGDGRDAPSVTSSASPAIPPILEPVGFPSTTDNDEPEFIPALKENESYTSTEGCSKEIGEVVASSERGRKGCVPPVTTSASPVGQSQPTTASSQSLGVCNKPETISTLEEWDPNEKTKVYVDDKEMIAGMPERGNEGYTYVMASSTTSELGSSELAATISRSRYEQNAHETISAMDEKFAAGWKMVSDNVSDGVTKSQGRRHDVDATTMSRAASEMVYMQPVTVGSTLSDPPGSIPSYMESSSPLAVTVLYGREAVHTEADATCLLQANEGNVLPGQKPEGNEPSVAMTLPPPRPSSDPKSFVSTGVAPEMISVFKGSDAVMSTNGCVDCSTEKTGLLGRRTEIDEPPISCSSVSDKTPSAGGSSFLTSAIKGGEGTRESTTSISCRGGVSVSPRQGDEVVASTAAPPVSVRGSSQSHAVNLPMQANDDALDEKDTIRRFEPCDNGKNTIDGSAVANNEGGAPQATEMATLPKKTGSPPWATAAEPDTKWAKNTDTSSNATIFFDEATDIVISQGAESEGDEPSDKNIFSPRAVISVASELSPALEDTNFSGVTEEFMDERNEAGGSPKRGLEGNAMGNATGRGDDGCESSPVVTASFASSLFSDVTTSVPPENSGAPDRIVGIDQNKMLTDADMTNVHEEDVVTVSLSRDHEQGAPPRPVVTPSPICLSQGHAVVLLQPQTENTANLKAPTVEDKRSAGDNKVYADYVDEAGRFPGPKSPRQRGEMSVKSQGMGMKFFHRSLAVGGAVMEKTLSPLREETEEDRSSATDSDGQHKMEEAENQYTTRVDSKFLCGSSGGGNIVESAPPRECLPATTWRREEVDPFRAALDRVCSKSPACQFFEGDLLIESAAGEDIIKNAHSFLFPRLSQPMVPLEDSEAFFALDISGDDGGEPGSFDSDDVPGENWIKRNDHNKDTSIGVAKQPSTASCAPPEIRPSAVTIAIPDEDSRMSLVPADSIAEVYPRSSLPLLEQIGHSDKGASSLTSSLNPKDHIGGADVVSSAGGEIVPCRSIGNDDSCEVHMQNFTAGGGDAEEKAVIFPAKDAKPAATENDSVGKMQAAVEIQGIFEREKSGEATHGDGTPSEVSASIIGGVESANEVSERGNGPANATRRDYDILSFSPQSTSDCTSLPDGNDERRAHDSEAESHITIGGASKASSKDLADGGDCDGVHVVTISADQSKPFDPEVLKVSSGARVTWQRRGCGGIGNDLEPETFVLRLWCPIVETGWQAVRSFSLKSTQPTFTFQFEKGGRFVISREVQVQTGADKKCGEVLVERVAGESESSAGESESSESFSSSEKSVGRSRRLESEVEGTDCKGDAEHSGGDNDDPVKLLSSTTEARGAYKGKDNGSLGRNKPDYKVKNDAKRVDGADDDFVMSLTSTKEPQDVSKGKSNDSLGREESAPPCNEAGDYQHCSDVGVANDSTASASLKLLRIRVPSVEAISGTPLSLSTGDASKGQGDEQAQHDEKTRPDGKSHSDGKSNPGKKTGPGGKPHPGDEPYSDGKPHPGENPHLDGNPNSERKTYPNGKPYPRGKSYLSGKLHSNRKPHPGGKPYHDEKPHHDGKLRSDRKSHPDEKPHSDGKPHSNEKPKINGSPPGDGGKPGPAIATPTQPQQETKVSRTKNRKKKAVGDCSGGGLEGVVRGHDIREFAAKHGASVMLGGNGTYLRKFGDQATAEEPAKTLIVSDRGFNPAKHLMVEIESIVSIKTRDVFSRNNNEKRSLYVVGPRIPKDQRAQAGSKKKDLPRTPTHTITSGEPLEVVFIRPGDYWLVENSSSKRIRITATLRESAPASECAQNKADISQESSSFSKDTGAVEPDQGSSDCSMGKEASSHPKKKKGGKGKAGNVCALLANAEDASAEEKATMQGATTSTVPSSQGENGVESGASSQKQSVEAVAIASEDSPRKQIQEETVSPLSSRLPPVRVKENGDRVRKAKYDRYGAFLAVAVVRASYPKGFEMHNLELGHAPGLGALIVCQLGGRQRVTREVVCRHIAREAVDSKSATAVVGGSTAGGAPPGVEADNQAGADGANVVYAHLGPGSLGVCSFILGRCGKYRLYFRDEVGASLTVVVCSSKDLPSPLSSVDLTSEKSSASISGVNSTHDGSHPRKQKSRHGQKSGYYARDGIEKLSSQRISRGSRGPDSPGQFSDRDDTRKSTVSHSTRDTGAHMILSATNVSVKSTQEQQESDVTKGWEILGNASGDISCSEAAATDNNKNSSQGSYTKRGSQVQHAAKLQTAHKENANVDKDVAIPAKTILEEASNAAAVVEDKTRATTRVAPVAPFETFKASEAATHQDHDAALSHSAIGASRSKKEGTSTVALRDAVTADLTDAAAEVSLAVVCASHIPGEFAGSKSCAMEPFARGERSAQRKTRVMFKRSTPSGAVPPQARGGCRSNLDVVDQADAYQIGVAVDGKRRHSFAVESTTVASATGTPTGWPVPIKGASWAQKDEPEAHAVNSPQDGRDGQSKAVTDICTKTGRVDPPEGYGGVRSLCADESSCSVRNVRGKPRSRRPRSPPLDSASCWSGTLPKATVSQTRPVPPPLSVHVLVKNNHHMTDDVASACSGWGSVSPPAACGNDGGWPPIEQAVCQRPTPSAPKSRDSEASSRRATESEPCGARNPPELNYASNGRRKGSCPSQDHATKSSRSAPTYPSKGSTSPANWTTHTRSRQKMGINKGSIERRAPPTIKPEAESTYTSNVSTSSISSSKRNPWSRRSEPVTEDTCFRGVLGQAHAKDVVSSSSNDPQISFGDYVSLAETSPQLATGNLSVSSSDRRVPFPTTSTGRNHEVNADPPAPSKHHGAKAPVDSQNLAKGLGKTGSTSIGGGGASLAKEYQTPIGVTVVMRSASEGGWGEEKTASVPESATTPLPGTSHDQSQFLRSSSSPRPVAKLTNSKSVEGAVCVPGTPVTTATAPEARDPASTHTVVSAKNLANKRTSRLGHCSTKIPLAERKRRNDELRAACMSLEKQDDTRVKARPAEFPEASRQPNGMYWMPEDAEDTLPPPSTYEIKETAYMMKIYDETMERLRTTGYDKELPNGYKPKIYDLSGGSRC